MSCKQESYKRLGDYIRLIDERNKDLSISTLLGLSMTKEFRPSTSNVVGTDLSKYKIVREGKFAFDTMSVIRVHKVPICYNNLGYPIIISPAYITFEIIDESILNPYYLKLLINRPEFDRYADFKSDSAIRGGYNWEELCETLVPIPNPAEQQRIVDQYNAIKNRIENNKKTIAKLEETAQAIYRKMFVDDIDPENLPDGWRHDAISTIIESTLGGDWGKEELEGNYVEKVTCIRGADINAMKECDMENAPVRYILSKNLKSRQLVANDIVIEMSGETPTQSTGRCSIALPSIISTCKNPMICSNFCKIIRAKFGMGILLYIALEYFYSLGYFFKYENSSNGIQNLDFESFCKEESIVIADANTIKLFSSQISKILEHKLNLGKENVILREILDQILISL